MTLDRSAPEIVDDVRRRSTSAARIRWPGAQVVEVTPIPGGHSGLTFGARLVVPHQEPRDIVVKFAPFGRPSAGRHDMLRQARVIGVLARVRGVVVPPLLWTADAPDGPMFATERVPGECHEPIMDAAQGNLRAPNVVRARMVRAAQMLGHMARADLLGELLGDGEVRTPRAELERWVPVMERVDPGLTRGAADLARILRANAPEPGQRPELVHGDYRLGNMLFNGTEPTGIIDWEIWSIGDSRVDLGWLALFTDASNLPGIAADVAGMPSVAEVVDAYQRVVGGLVESMPWFIALAAYRMAAISGDNLRRHREGRFVDPFQERLPPSIVRSIELGLEILAGQPSD